MTKEKSGLTYGKKSSIVLRATDITSFFLLLCRFDQTQTDTKGNPCRERDLINHLLEIRYEYVTAKFAKQITLFAVIILLVKAQALLFGAYSRHERDVSVLYTAGRNRQSSGPPGKEWKNMDLTMLVSALNETKPTRYLLQYFTSRRETGVVPLVKRSADVRRDT